MAILPLSSGDELVQVIGRLRARFAAYDPPRGAPHRLSLSVGAAVFDPGIYKDADRYIARLDALMYVEKMAKRKSRAEGPGPEGRSRRIQYEPAARPRLAPQPPVGGDGNRLAHLQEEGQIVYRVAVEGAVGEVDASGPREGEDGVALRGAEEGRARESSRAAPPVVFEAAREDRFGAEEVRRGAAR